MLKDYFEVPNKPAIKSGNILSCDFTDHETFIPQPLDYSRGTIATYVDCNGLIKMSGVSDINLVTNGTFETPVDSSQWLNFGSPLVAERSQDQAYEGSFSYHIKSTGGNVGTQASASQFSGDYVVGDVIQVKAYVYPIIASSNYIRSGVSNSDRSITSVVSGLVLNQWNLIEYYAKITTASNNYVTFLTSGAGEFYLDNVSVKKVDVDIPRIDYTTEIGKAKELQKPSLLLEPQSTNLIPFSEDITTYSAINATVTSNVIKSPDGTINSDKVNFSVTSGFSRVLVSSSGNQTYSLYVKYDTLQHIMIYANGLNGGRHIDIKNRIIGNSLGTAYTFTIENVGNDWSRITMFGTSAIGTSLEIYASTGTSYSPITIEGSVYIWGVQGEATAYATSYIPTSGSTVTRNKDIASNAGQLGVFNSEEGVLYAEIASNNTGTARILSLSDNTTSNSIRFEYRTLANQIRVRYRNGGATQNDFIYTLSNEEDFNKIAFKYKVNDFSLYVNGTEVNTDTSGSVVAANTFTTLKFQRGDGSNYFYGKVKEVKVFRRALTDAELTELTNNIV